MRNVLVTGGAGFVGSHLVEALLGEGCRVTVLDNYSDALRQNLSAVENEYELIEADVRDERVSNRVGSIDAIFHLAANANVPRSSQYPMFDASINILGTINMLNLARARNAHFILASSGAVYGEPVQVPIAESHPLIPISPYGVSKLSAEYYVELYKRLYGIRATIVRFFNTYGPRQRRYVVFDFAHKILKSGPEVIVLGSGQQIRSQLFILDAIRALFTIVEVGDDSIYNIGSAISFPVTHLMHEMLALFSTTKVLKMTQSSWEGDIQSLVPDVSKLHALGFQEHVSLQEGLALFKQWFKAEYAAEYEVQRSL